MATKHKSGPNGLLWHSQFLTMLPMINRQAKFAFRNLDAEAGEEAIAEAVAFALAAYVRLVEKRRTADAFPTTLARWAIAQVRQGRHLGGRLNCRDALSRYARRNRGSAGYGVVRWDEAADEGDQIGLAKSETPADEAAFRVDFAAWLDTLTPRDRMLAGALATGEQVKAIAKTLKISPARVCQLRKNLRLSWARLHGEDCG